MNFLMYASRELGSSLDYKHTLAKLSKLIVPQLADWFALDILNDRGEIELVTLAHNNPEKVEQGIKLRKQFPPNLQADQAGLPRVLKTGVAELYEDIDEDLIKTRARNQHHYKILMDVGFHSAMIVPLKARGKIFGAVTFVTTKTSGKNYSKTDLELAQEFAQRAAFAIDNAQLYEKAQAEIAERKKIEEKIKESEARFKLMADTAPVMIWMADADRKSDYYNKRYLEFTGCTSHELSGNGWKKLMHPDDLQYFDNTVVPLYDQEQPFQIEFRLKRHDGEYRWILDSGTPRFDSDDTFIGYIGSCIDITETKLVQEELEKAKDQLEIIIKNIADGITVQDKDGRLIFMNDTAAQMCGYESAEEMFAAPEKEWMQHFELVDENGKPFLLDQLPGRRALQGEENPEATILYRNKLTKDEHWSIIKAKPVYDQFDNVEFAVNVIGDVTERKLAEKKKDEFIGIASHELKTPLTSIKAFTQLLKRYLSQKDDIKAMNYLERMDNQLNRLTVLVEDLLDVSRIQAGKLVFNEDVFIFDDVVKEIIEEIRPTSTKHTIIKQGTAEHLVLADRYRIGQVLTNLLTNAIKYSPEGGDIIVKTTCDQNKVTFSVQDFGIGIPKKMQEKIFNRFYRANGGRRESFPGLGLGLYISSEIMKRHNGAIWVESKEGKGSTFYFTLPITLHSRLIVETTQKPYEKNYLDN